nr:MULTISPECIES: GDCCVxC domain-containing (seleno)protein [Oceanibaculum]
MTVLQSTITCPTCGHVSVETMLENACQYFYECGGCKSLLRPLPSDCCVFCSYGDTPCPPIQKSRAKGHAGGCCAQDGG